MPSTYSPLLRTELIAPGEQAGSWGLAANNTLGTIIEAAIAGTVTIAMPAGSADYTLSANNGVVDESRNSVIKVTGVLTASRNIICPSSSKHYLVYNATSGDFLVTLKTAAGTGVSIPQGGYVAVYCDGANVVRTSADIPVVTTAQRDTVPSFGRLQANPDLSRIEWWNGSAWTPAGGGATGGGTDAAFCENDATITTPYTLGQASLISGATVTISTPGVVTLTGHGFIADSQVFFETTGALPTGLLVDTGYWVIAAGLTTNAFQLSLTQGGAAINTTGTQSGTHSCGKLKNATSAGTMTIATGVTITIPSGATWVIGS